MTTRLFVAIWPDAPSRHALATTVDRARPAAPDVRWQPPERWHITLAFLGQAEPGTAQRRIAQHVADDQPDPGPIHLTGAGSFGPVIWVGVEDGSWLTALAEGMQRTLRVADRRFRAHVTIGRVRGAGGPARAREVVPLLSAYAGPVWTPTEVTLVESTTGPAPEYRIRGRWPLGPSGRTLGPPAPSLDTPAGAVTDSAAPENLEDL